MATSSALRDTALRVLRRVKDAFDLRASSGVSDDDFVREAFAAACTTEGISPQEYAATRDTFPDLAELERETLREGLAGTTDPGPHAAISRESPSGQFGDLRKNSSHPFPSDRGLVR